MSRYEKFLTKTLNPAITAGAYSANDVVGGLLEFDLAELTANGGILDAVQVTDKGTQSAAMKLFLFESQPATIANNDAFAPSDAENATIFAIVTISTYTTLTNSRVCISDTIQRVFSTTKGKIWGYLVCDATPTFASVSDIFVTLRILSE